MKGIDKKARAALGSSVFSLAFALVTLAAAQICVEPPAGLVGWWPGDGNANDITGTNNGTLQGNVTFTAGKVEQGFSFDGVDGSFVRITHEPELDAPGDFTWDFWLRTTDATIDSGFRRVIRKQAGPNSLFINYMGGVQSGRMWFQIGDGVQVSIVFGTTFVSDDQFHHVVFLRDTTNRKLKIYVDGVLDGQADDTTTGSITNTAPVEFGGDSETPPSLSAGPNDLNGVVDEIEYLNRALSDEEIQAIVNAGSAGKCKPLGPSCQGGRSHIRGWVIAAEDSVGLRGVTLALTGPGPCQETTTTNALGFYLLPHLHDGTYTVTPSDTQCTFAPPSSVVTIEGGYARLNFAATCP